MVTSQFYSKHFSDATAMPLFGGLKPALASKKSEALPNNLAFKAVYRKAKAGVQPV